MLSLKANISSAGASPSTSPFHHRPTVGASMAAEGPALVVDEEAVDQAMSEQTYASSSSLLDSMSSSTTTTNCSSSMTSFNSSQLQMKRTSKKSSFALTSLVQHLHEEDHSNNHSKSSLGTTSLTAVIAADVRAPMKPIPPSEFGRVLQLAIEKEGGEMNIDFRDNRVIRQALEAPLRTARTMRDSCRRAATFFDTAGSSATSQANSPLPLCSWVGLPYASLRNERPFLYDHTHTHPLSELLAQCLSTKDLSQLHQGWNPQVETAKDHQQRVFAPLFSRDQREPFQEAYDSFVTSCCLPLLHAAALRGNVFNGSNRHHHSVRNDPVLYRYQVFPTINVVYPNDPEGCQPPTCDLSEGKSVGWLHFHVPLTASQGTSALYCEHFPGREDWHPLRCTQVGLGYCWDGARCLSFVPLNTTGQTRVSLDFRILMVRTSTAISTCSLSELSRPGVVDDDTLCRPHHLQDALTRVPGFYKEITMDGSGSSYGGLMDPDARCGFPFA